MHWTSSRARHTVTCYTKIEPLNDDRIETQIANIDHLSQRTRKREVVDRTTRISFTFRRVANSIKKPKFIKFWAKVQRIIGLAFFRMNEISFSVSEQGWNGSNAITTTNASAYMQPAYSEYLSLPFKIEPGTSVPNNLINTSNQQVRKSELLAMKIIWLYLSIKLLRRHNPTGRRLQPLPPNITTFTTTTRFTISFPPLPHRWPRRPQQLTTAPPTPARQVSFPLNLRK